MNDPSFQETIEVTTPSGAVFEVLTGGEQRFFEIISDQYIRDNHFVNVSDLRDLDRVLMMELMVYRWNSWLSKEVDYFDQTIDPDELKKAISEFSKEIRLIKKSLGVDKVTREKDKGESINERWEDICRRAKEFGYNRNEQAVKAITLFQELKALFGLHHNCDEKERKENHIELSDILEWIEKVAIPEFDEIDANFRETGQKFWIRDQ